MPDVRAANDGTTVRFRVEPALLQQRQQTARTQGLGLGGLMRSCLGTTSESVGPHLFDLHNVRMHQLFMVDDLPLHILADLHTAPMLLRVLGRRSYPDLQEDSLSGAVMHV